MDSDETKVVNIANTISGVLGHGHTLTLEELEQVTSLRELQAAWIRKGRAENKGKPEGCIGGLEGWTVEEKPYRLSHVTHSGRLRVMAWGEEESSGPGVSLEVYAGPSPFGEGKAGRLAATVDLHSLGEDFRGRVEYLNPDLLEGRLDRIQLIRELDEALEGLITSTLKGRGRGERDLLQLLQEEPAGKFRPLRIRRLGCTCMGRQKADLIRLLILTEVVDLREVYVVTAGNDCYGSHVLVYRDMKERQLVSLSGNVIVWDGVPDGTSPAWERTIQRACEGFFS